MDSLLVLALASVAAAVLANLAVHLGAESRDGFVGRPAGHDRGDSALLG